MDQQLGYANEEPLMTRATRKCFKALISAILKSHLMTHNGAAGR